MKKVNVLAMTGMAALSIAAMSPVTSYAIPASFQLPGRGTALVVGSSRDAFCNLEDILNQIGQIAGGENCVQRPEGSRPEGNRPGRQSGLPRRPRPQHVKRFAPYPARKRKSNG